MHQHASGSITIHLGHRQTSTTSGHILKSGCIKNIGAHQGHQGASRTLGRNKDIGGHQGHL